MMEDPRAPAASVLAKLQSRPSIVPTRHDWVRIANDAVGESEIGALLNRVLLAGDFEALPLAKEEVSGAADRLRSLVEGSHHPLLRAKGFDALWTTLRRRADGVAAISAYVEVAELEGAAERWELPLRAIVRATWIAARLRSFIDFGACVRALMAFRPRLENDDAGVFGRIADDLSWVLFGTTWSRSRVAEEVSARWATALEECVTRHLMAHVWSEELIAREALVRWYTRASDAARADRARSALVQRLVEVAPHRPHAEASRLLASAVEMARSSSDLHLRALADAAMVDLQAQVYGATLSGRTERTPWETLATAVVEAARGGIVPVLQLAWLPGLLDLSREKSREGHSRDCGVGRDSSRRERERSALFALASMHAHRVQALLSPAVETFARSGAPALVAVFEREHLDDEVIVLLQRAAERIERRDWISSGLISLHAYEISMRRLAGLDSIAVPIGVVLEEPKFRRRLGGNHAAFAEAVLAAHATEPWKTPAAVHSGLRASEMTGDRVLLVWLLIIRLLCRDEAISPPDVDRS